MASLDEYLAFLGYKGDKEPTMANLKQLHSLHLHKVVFENMSCIIGEDIQLDIDWLFDKIVKRGRGGFCFELNGLFHWLVTSMGYSVQMVSAAVVAPTPSGFSFPLDHMINVVSCPSGRGKVLCDVGFGKHTFTTPLPVQVGLHKTENGVFRVVSEADGEIVIQKLGPDGKWNNTCKVNMETERRLEDFAEQCRYHQMDQTAYMAGNSLACRYLDGGEVRTLLGRSFRRYSSNNERVETADSKDDMTDPEVNQILKEEFGIQLSRDIVPRRFDPSSFNV